MRRSTLPNLAPMVGLATFCLSLAACSGSGFWAYERDTLTLPGENPNVPAGAAENFERAKHGTLAEPAPLLTEAGDIWPTASHPVPTLKDLQKQQTEEISGGGTGATMTPLPPLPSLPGYEISSQQTPTAAPPVAFPGNAVLGRPGHAVPIEGQQGYKAPAGTASGNIVVPNGNGTSTVISPTGQVSTIPTPK